MHFSSRLSLSCYTHDYIGIQFVVYAQILVELRLQNASFNDFFPESQCLSTKKCSNKDIKKKISLTRKRLYLRYSREPLKNVYLLFLFILSINCHRIQILRLRKVKLCSRFFLYEKESVDLVSCSMQQPESQKRWQSTKINRKIACGEFHWRSMWRLKIAGVCSMLR